MHNQNLTTVTKPFLRSHITLGTTMRFVPKFISSLILLICLAQSQLWADSDEAAEIVSRVQTNLNRVAAGLEPIWPATAVRRADYLVLALQALMTQDAAGIEDAGRLLRAIEADIQATLIKSRNALYSDSRRAAGMMRDFGQIERSLNDTRGQSWRSDSWLHLAIVAHKLSRLMALQDGNVYDHTRLRLIKLPCRAGDHIASFDRILALQVHGVDITSCPSGQRYARLTPPDGPLDAARFVRENRAAIEAHMHGAEQGILPAEGTWQWASLHMGDRPVEAEALLAASSSAEARYQHALFLFFFRPASIERDERIRRDMGLYLTALEKTWEQGNSEFDFDKNPELASRLSVGQLVAGRIYTDVVPCVLLVKIPSWVGITEPAFGSTRDYFLPRSGCSVHDSLMAGFPFADFEAFRELSNSAARPFAGGGSIRYSLFTSQLSTGYWMQFDPRQFDLETTPPVAVPYQTWGYLSLSNQALYRQIAALYPKLKEQLASFYGRFGLVGATAERAADAGLYNYAFGPDCGGAPPPQSFRKLLLDGASLGDIKDFADSALWRSRDTLAPYRVCGPADPMAHIAIVDMRAFAYLQDLSRTLSVREQVDLDLVMGVGAVNIFGKTPLMSAAQHDRLEAVRWLIANGGDVNSVTDSTSLLFGRRTALMYAAASGSLSAISTLIESGADPHQADTMGKSAVDYLLGVGPESEPPNPRLTDAEFAAAYELLR